MSRQAHDERATGPAASLCPHALGCGGCPLIEQPRRQQLASKMAMLEVELRARGIRYPRIELSLDDSDVHYRNRLRLRVAPHGDVDFFNPQKALGCAVLEVGLASLVERLRVLSRQSAALSGVDHVEARGVDDDGTSGLVLYPGHAAPEGSRWREALLPLGNDVAVGISSLDDAERMPRQRRSVAHDAYCLVPLDGFMQVNSAVNRQLVATVRGMAVERSLRTFLDLFAGSGNFSLPLARAGLCGVAVESSRSSCHALTLAAAQQALCVRVRPGDAFALADDGREPYDLVVVDAPRGGARRGLAPAASIARQCLALVSCNAQTFARDLQLLLGSGFVLERIVTFDMFPHTRHLEMLAWLARVAR